MRKIFPSNGLPFSLVKILRLEGDTNYDPS
jgi:hypothetical protein